VLTHVGRFHSLGEEVQVAGIWWNVEVDGDMLRVEHGPTIGGVPMPPHGRVLVTPAAAAELAVALVQHALAVDDAVVTRTVMTLWAHEQLREDDPGN
jgi:hypothetical protein